MHGITRITLTVPFALILIQYLNFVLMLLEDPAIPEFWQNHGLREAIFASVLCAVVLNHLWSTKVDQYRLRLIMLLGAPLVFGFWVAELIVGFDPAGNLQDITLYHTVEAVTFVIGYFMAVSVWKGHGAKQ